MTEQPSGYGEKPASQRELDLLRQDQRDTARRLDDMDRNGTRGVQGLQIQLTDVIKDVVKLAADVETFKKDHLHEHERDRQERINGRRWLVGTGIAALVALVVVITLLLQVLGKIH